MASSNYISIPVFSPLWISLMLVVLCHDANALCGSRTYSASTVKKTFSYMNYQNNEICYITIQPSYSRGYYLEIGWDQFDVEGYMPSCSHDYIEVFLTSQSKSIGRYCSDNIGVQKLFKMYSADGYAKIFFKTDSSITRKGFQFTYQLKSYSSGYLGTYGRDNCYYNIDSKYAGIFYSSGWPKGYTKGDACTHSLNVAEKRHTRIAVMDLNLRSISTPCNSSSDNVVARESSAYYSSLLSIILFGTAVTKTLCSTWQPGIATATKQHTYITFTRPLGSYPTYTERGFMIGYISFSTDICFQNPCINGGTCVASGNSRSCSCPPGFTGALCQFEINECTSEPCQNGGTCAEKINGYNCTCTPEYSGKNCETKKDSGDTLTTILTGAFGSTGAVLVLAFVNFIVGLIKSYKGGEEKGCCTIFCKININCK